MIDACLPDGSKLPIIRWHMTAATAYWWVDVVGGKEKRFCVQDHNSIQVLRFTPTAAAEFEQAYTAYLKRVLQLASNLHIAGWYRPAGCTLGSLRFADKLGKTTDTGLCMPELSDVSAPGPLLQACLLGCLETTQHLLSKSGPEGCSWVAKIPDRISGVKLTAFTSLNSAEVLFELEGVDSVPPAVTASDVSQQSGATDSANITEHGPNHPSTCAIYADAGTAVPDSPSEAETKQAMQHLLSMDVWSE